MWMGNKMNKNKVLAFILGVLIASAESSFAQISTPIPLPAAQGGTGVTAAATGTGSVVLNTTPTFAGTPVLSTSGSPQFKFTDTNTARSAYFGIGDSGFNAVINMQDGGAGILFQSGGTTRMSMDTNGNLTLTNSVILNGSTSGTAQIKAPAVAGSAILTLPGITGTLLSSTSPQVIRSYLAGCTLSTAGSSATMSIAACSAADSTNAAMLTLAAFSKTTSAWTLGSAGGAMDTGVVANSTWYHWFVIQRTDTGVVDVLFSLSATAPTMPTNYTLFRRIGSGKTNGSAQWVSFIQDGDLFQWLTPVLDIDASSSGTSAVTRTLASIPTSVNVRAFLNVAIFGGAGSQGLVYLSDLAAADLAPASNAAPLVSLGAGIVAVATYGQQVVRTNTSAQIRSREGATDSVLRIATLGWTDRRGKDN